MTHHCELYCRTSKLPCEVLLPITHSKIEFPFGCQPGEPLASLVTTNRVINVYGFLVVIMLLMYSVLHCLHSFGNKITTTTKTISKGSSKVWHDITHPFPNPNRCDVRVYEWICNFIPTFCYECNYLSMLGWNTKIKVNPRQWKWPQ